MRARWGREWECIEHSFEKADKKNLRRSVVCADLEASVAYAGYALGLLEVVGRRVAALLSLPCIVHTELGHLSQAAALLAEIAYHAHTAALCTLDGSLQCEDEVGPTRADVSAEHVRPTTLVMHAHRHLSRLLLQLGNIAEEVHSNTAHRRQVRAACRVEHMFVLCGRR